jgi:C4-type Zn-finger protein
MSEIKCPVCGRYKYVEYQGEYDIPDDFGGAKKLSPDGGFCSHCGFRYSEHINYPFEKQVEDYKKEWQGR